MMEDALGRRTNLSVDLVAGLDQHFCDLSTTLSMQGSFHFHACRSSANRYQERHRESSCGSHRRIPNGSHLRGQHGSRFPPVGKSLRRPTPARSPHQTATHPPRDRLANRSIVSTAARRAPRSRNATLNSSPQAARAFAIASFSPFSSSTPAKVVRPMTKEGVPAKLKASAWL